MNAKPTQNDVPNTPFAALSLAIGRSRYITLISVIAVLLVAASLFLLGAVLVCTTIKSAWIATFQGHEEHALLTLAFLEIVSIMLEAVVFFLVGVGLYSLFIAPINIALALGVETLNDLEEKIISVVVAVMATTFLQHFIKWEKPLETLEFGIALALVVGALVAFLSYSHKAKESQVAHKPNIHDAAQYDLFHGGQEAQTIPDPESTSV